MSNSTVQFVTRMKLRELHYQRAKLHDAYQQLDQEIAATSDDGERILKLSQGLRELNFAGQPLHPEVVNLEILQHAIGSGALSAELLSLWRKRLEDELAAGRLRSEFVYLFGALLEEWARDAAADPRLREESQQAHRRLREHALGAITPNRHAEVIDPLFADLGPALTGLEERLREMCRKSLHVQVQKGELTEALERLAKDIYQPPPLRREARRILANKLLSKELNDALSILMAELHSWDWPVEGLTTRALWTRNKWRLYLYEDLATACLLEILGLLWIDVLDRFIGDRSQVRDRRARLKKLTELKAPQVIVENERRMLREAEQLVDLGSSEEKDIWDTTETPEGWDQDPEYDSILEKRAAAQRSLRRLDVGRDYDGEYGTMNRAIPLVHAEIQLARAVSPQRPIHVLKVDLRDFYASIPHDVLLTVLRRLGLAEEDLAFFARFLSAQLRDESGTVRRMRRGVPMNHALSGMLAELLLRLLEKHVLLRARVRIVRLVDDLCVLSPEAGATVAAWEALVEFCAACGLRVNEEKSGAVCLGGPPADGLPRGRPRWGMLELDEQGEWQVHEETFATHLKQTRERVNAAPSILSRVQLYNANLKYLLESLTLGADLGESHRDSTERAIGRFHHHFFGPDKGIVAGICETIRTRFDSGGRGLGDIPEGWVYWPITAGGLALRNPLVVAGQYAVAFRGREHGPIPSPPPPPGWNRHANEWSAVYFHWLKPFEPIEPSETKVMQTLVNDFIARGKDISAGQQTDLDPYWRWILCTYGPQILQRFGSFRFLITELVPLQLISRQLVQDSSLEDGKPPEVEADEPIPF
jgi:hypothetical protein